MLRRIQKPADISPEEDAKLEVLRKKFRTTEKDRKKLSNKIANGNIPIGPKADHSRPVEHWWPKLEAATRQLLAERAAGRNGYTWTGNGANNFVPEDGSWQ